MLQQQEKQAQLDKIAALQDTARGDTASLMARYGAIAAFTQGAKG